MPSLFPQTAPAFSKLIDNCYFSYKRIFTLNGLHCVRLASSWGRRSHYSSDGKFRMEDFPGKGGDLMTPIVKWTRFGDTILVSNPYHAAEALVTWACVTHGHPVHSIVNVGNGCVKVDIPGLTSITYAPENMPN